MSNYRRFREGRIYFFTVVIHKRRAILTMALGRRVLWAAILLVRHERPLEFTAIVLLPDHLQALWQLP